MKMKNKRNEKNIVGFWENDNMNYVEIISHRPTWELYAEFTELTNIMNLESQFDCLAICKQDLLSFVAFTLLQVVNDNF